jgi:hypothetical protein
MAGKMTSEQAADAIASTLEKLAYRIRMGELKVTGCDQRVFYERYYVKETAHAFRIGDTEMTLRYHDPDQQMQERNKRTAFLMDHPDAEKA